jgi:hypothetical protein
MLSRLFLINLPVLPRINYICCVYRTFLRWSRDVELSVTQVSEETISVSIHFSLQDVSRGKLRSVSCKFPFGIDKLQLKGH